MINGVFQRKLRDRWTRGDEGGLGEDEAFLRDYLISKQYDTDDVGRIPDYKEVVADIEEKEAEEDRMDRFEQKYNFRFEEPGHESVSASAYSGCAPVLI